MAHGESADTTLERYVRLSDDLGVGAAAKKIGIKRETLRRRIREYKQRTGGSEKPFDEKLMRQLAERFNDAELRRLLSTSSFSLSPNKIFHDFSGDVVTFGVFSDTHLGSVFTYPDLIYDVFEEFSKQGVDFICHTGDVTEGLSNRAGHVYECSHIGYSAQLDHSREVFAGWTETPIYAISGNHDQWYLKSNGANIVEGIDNSLDNFHFLGHDEGDIEIGPVKIKLWHGLDGSSYAFSYRIQKIVESLTGGEKPNVLLCGHTHKAIYVYDRHVHCVSAGAIQKQSRWMRSKRHASHTGFWVCRMGLNDHGVGWFEQRFYPFYQ